MGKENKAEQEGIEQLESKFCAEEAWRNAIGAGIMTRAKEKIEELQADTDLEIVIEQEEAIKALAAKNTKDMLNRSCPLYDDLISIMGQHAGINPLSMAETFVRLQQSQSNGLESSTDSETQSPS
ncbi:hypothetical protein DFH28DRAFT_925400 [Melampsora americana]|nr:hypothetical protein DFH28DRAFT_925400 [Melampsora americana]